jgi:hypothetical protein
MYIHTLHHSYYVPLPVRIDDLRAWLAHYVK